MYSRISIIALMAAGLLAVGAVSAQAASIQLDLQYAGTTSNFSDFSDSLKPAPELSDAVDPLLDYHKFEVYMTVSDTLPEENFWTALFNIDLGPGMVPGDFGGFSQWTPNNPDYDPNSPAVPPPAAPIYSDSTDSGASDHDLQRMFIQVASATLAASQPGEPGQDAQLGPVPLLLGDFYVQWDQSIAAATSVSISPEGQLPWGLYIDGTETAQGSDSFSGNRLDFVFPEPASITLAGLAMIGLLGMFRRRK